MAEHAIPFWTSSLISEELMKSMNWKKFPPFPDSYPSTSNIVSHYPHPKFRETPFNLGSSSGLSCAHTTLRSEQKSVDATRLLIWKYSSWGSTWPVNASKGLCWNLERCALETFTRKLARGPSSLMSKMPHQDTENDSSVNRETLMIAIVLWKVWADKNAT